MKVSGDEWDAPILAELVRQGVGVEGGAESLETARAVMLRLAGDSFGRFAQASLPALATATRSAPAEAVRALLDTWAWYYVTMAGVIGGDHTRLRGWDASVERVRTCAGDGASVVVTMQIGLPLLVPLLVAEATGRPTAVFMHRRNALALELMTRGRVEIRVLDLERMDLFEVMRLGRSGWNIAANIDVAYPGARAVDLDLMGRVLHAPAGVLHHVPRRTGQQVLGLALLSEGDRLEAPAERLGSAGRGASEDIRDKAAGFFGKVIGASPLQWMSWASLV